jgi:hypothetical protein
MKLLPTSIVFSPHFDSMSFNNTFEIYNPRAVPENDFEANFENSFGIISA